MTVSKRVGQAVVRNRVKRLIREIFRTHRHLISGDWDINVIAKKQAASITYSQALHSLTQLLGKMAKKEKKDDGH